MNRRAQEGEGLSGFGVVASIILAFVAIALVLISFFGFTANIQQSFMDSICKFEVALRATIIGSPVVQALSGVFNFFTRGFTTMSAGMFGGLQLQSCTPGTSLQTTKDKPITINEMKTLLKKIGDETARCWDLFGNGNWDSLLYSRGGLSFTCWRDTVYIKCSGADNTHFNVTRSTLDSFLNANEYEFGSYAKAYFDIFPRSMPRFGPESFLTCDDTLRAYVIELSFIDKLLISSGPSIITLLCDTIAVGSLNGDTIYLCIFEKGGV